MPYGVIKTRKRVVDAGAWSAGKVPPKAFPTQKAITLPSRARWRCLKLRPAKAGLSADLRLLVAVQVEKGEFNAWLGQVVAGKLFVLAALESHATHPGVHCHAACQKGLPSYSGSLRYPDMKVAPRHGSSSKRTYRWSETQALAVAFKFYEVDDKPEGAML